MNHIERTALLGLAGLSIYGLVQLVLWIIG